jgi:hypothetical protein
MVTMIASTAKYRCLSRIVRCAATYFYISWLEATTPALTKTQTGKDYGLNFGFICTAENAKVGKPIECTVPPAEG